MANKISKFKRLLKIAIASAIVGATIYVGVSKFKDFVDEAQYRRLSKQQVERIDSLKATGSISKEEIQRNVNLMVNVLNRLQNSQDVIDALESIRKGDKDPVFADPRTGISERIKILRHNLSEAERDAKKIDPKILPTTEIKARISQLQKILKDLEKELL